VGAFERRAPIYLRIYRDLRDAIAAGRLEPDERLPGQRELARHYGVTVMTVRQALQLLEQEEAVVMRQGLGTFVAPRRIEYALGNLRSFAQTIMDQGLELKTRVLSRQLSEPHPHIAEQLGREPGELVYSIERLRFICAAAVVYQHSHLQPWLGEALDTVELSNRSLYEYLQRDLDVQVARAKEDIHAVALGAREASLLEREPGAPALLSERLTLSVDDEPLIFDRALMPGDRVSISTDRFVSDMTLGYEVRVGEEVG